MNEEEKSDLSPIDEAIQGAAEENWKEKYVRLLAEQENFRKRSVKDRQEMTRFGIEQAIAEFLPAIDNLENALKFASQGSPEVKNWALGFEMILSQLKGVLEGNGITAFSSEGMKFDPNLHEAVEIVETKEALDGVVLQEFSKGYRSALRTVRPARVKVAKAPAPATPSLEKEELKEHNVE